MDYGILGPLELHHDGARLRVPGGRQRELLALLIARARQAVPSSEIIDLLWRGDPPARAANALQQLVFQVRSRLAEADASTVLVTTAGGYRLEAADEAIDARRFERGADDGRRALADGDAEGAVRRLVDALALWRGEALEDVDAPWASAEARRLGERRLAAREALAEARLALGEHDAVIAELETLVAAHPLRERLRGQLMLALAGSGRQAEALQTYAEGRELLAAELGLDPSPLLEGIHADVLGQRVAVGWSGQPPGPMPADRTALRPPPSAVGAADQRPPGAPAGLPAPVTRILGREAELERVVDLLAGERIVTLTGPGGAGKSRLALEVARESAVGTAAAHLAELAPVAGEQALLATVGDALGLASSPDRASLEGVLVAVGDREVLLVLDNAEHVLTEVAALVAALARRCPAARVLVTSREPLGVSGEIVWPVPPLPVPSPAVEHRDAAEAYAAVRLLVERVRAVVPGYELTDAEVPTVVRLVRALDGLPLAIELAAARARALSLPDLARQLSDRFEVLRDERPGAASRHRTLEDAISWSWELLEEPQRRAWMAAAVPAGAFDATLLARLLDAAGGSLDPLAAVTALCDRSILTVAERERSTRYRMLESLREFGLQRLAEAGLEPTVRDAHAAEVEAAVTRVSDADDGRWQVDLPAQERLLPEVRSALTWRAARGDLRGMQRLAAALGWLWYLRGLPREGLRWLDAALGPVDEVDPGDVEPDAVLWQALLRTHEPGADDTAARWTAQAVAAAATATQRELARLCEVAQQWFAGDRRGAREAVRGHPAAHGWVEGMWRLLEGEIELAAGELREAERHLRQAESILVEHGAAWGRLRVGASHVALLQLHGDVTRLRAAAERYLDGADREAAGNLQGEVEVHATLAMVAAARGEPSESARWLALARDRARGLAATIARALVAYAEGYVALEEGELCRARERLGDALALHDRDGRLFGRAFGLWGLGAAALREGGTAEAAGWHARAYATARAQAAGDEAACALEGLAAACASRGDAGTAARLLGAAARHRERIGAGAAILARAPAEEASALVDAALGPALARGQRERGAALDVHALDALVERVAVVLGGED